MQKVLLIALIAFSCSLTALSQTQPDTNKEASRAYLEADRSLNEVYQKILEKNRAKGKFLKNLRNVQRAWINYRDAEFTLKYPETVIHDHGTKITDSQAAYLTKLTEERTKILQELLNRHSGGTITYANGYTIHTFTVSGTFSCLESGLVEVLVVAGGGGGGGTIRGGGGGGGVIYNASYFTSGDIAVTVGAGGLAGTAGETSGFHGENSSFGSLTAIGGGSGDAGSGGSGGGANRGQTVGGAGTVGQGNEGGGGLAVDNTCGGGGGAGAAGGPGNLLAGGDGGNGLCFSISGSSVYYAGGGGGGARVGDGRTAGTGGIGGGGNGGVITNGTSGVTNSGGGGGAGGFGGGGFEGYRSGGNGGSGIVIVRYPVK